MVEENEDLYEFFMPPASSEEVGGVVYSIFTWRKDFRVASGAPLNVIKQSSGAQAISACTASGTIR